MPDKTILKNFIKLNPLFKFVKPIIDLIPCDSLNNTQKLTMKETDGPVDSNFVLETQQASGVAKVICRTPETEKNVNPNQRKAEKEASGKKENLVITREVKAAVGQIASSLESAGTSTFNFLTISKDVTTLGGRTVKFSDTPESSSQNLVSNSSINSPRIENERIQNPQVVAQPSISNSPAGNVTRSSSASPCGRAQRPVGRGEVSNVRQNGTATSSRLAGRLGGPVSFGWNDLDEGKMIRVSFMAMIENDVLPRRCFMDPWAPWSTIGPDHYKGREGKIVPCTPTNVVYEWKNKGTVPYTFDRKVMGAIKLPSGDVVNHQFGVVTPFCMNATFGLDFILKHRIVVDWWPHTGRGLLLIRGERLEVEVIQCGPPCPNLRDPSRFRPGDFAMRFRDLFDL